MRGQKSRKRLGGNSVKMFLRGNAVILMALFPERLFGRRKEAITYTPETPKITENLTQETGVEKIETAFTANIKDDKGQPMVQTPQTQTIAIQVPANQTQLTQTAKGSVSEAITWWALYWIRAIQKAIHFGKKIIFGSPIT